MDTKPDFEPTRNTQLEIDPMTRINTSHLVIVSAIFILQGSYHLFFQLLLPCCILKTAHEIMRMIYVRNHSWSLACLKVSALVISWTYLSAISLAACILFHLACNLQVIHFNDYTKVLEKESSIMTLMDEHMRLRGYLSKISHRFRIYLILVFLFVTASLCMTLVQITGVNGRVTFLNGGNFDVSTAFHF